MTINLLKPTTGLQSNQPIQQVTKPDYKDNPDKTIHLPVDQLEVSESKRGFSLFKVLVGTAAGAGTGALLGAGLGALVSRTPATISIGVILGAGSGILAGATSSVVVSGYERKGLATGVGSGSGAMVGAISGTVFGVMLGGKVNPYITGLTGVTGAAAGAISGLVTASISD